MLWLLGKNLYRERGYEDLVTALQRRGLPYQVVVPVPFVEDRIVSIDTDLSKARGDVESLPEPDVDASKGLWVMGSYTLCKVAHRRGWRPAAFFKGLDYVSWATKYRVVNPPEGTLLLAFGQIQADDLQDETFIRPVLDSKSFSGKVFKRKDFLDWQREVLHINPGPDEQLHAGTMVTLSQPKVILTETRFFVVDGKVVTGSLYKRGKQVFYSSDVNQNVQNFAQQCVDSWNPSRAFVIDIAELEDGPAVVELNCFNAAGFYACDVGKIVEAVSNAFDKEQQ